MNRDHFVAYFSFWLRIWQLVKPLFSWCKRSELSFDDSQTCILDSFLFFLHHLLKLTHLFQVLFLVQHDDLLVLFFLPNFEIIFKVVVKLENTVNNFDNLVDIAQWGLSSFLVVKIGRMPIEIRIPLSVADYFFENIFEKVIHISLSRYLLHAPQHHLQEYVIFRSLIESNGQYQQWNWA